MRQKNTIFQNSKQKKIKKFSVCVSSIIAIITSKKRSLFFVINKTR